MANCLQAASGAVEMTKGDVALFADCWLELSGVLVNLDGLDGLFERFVGVDAAEFKIDFEEALRAEPWRVLVSASVLDSIRCRFPSMRLNLFSCLPEACRDAILEACWPGFKWDRIASPVSEPFCALIQSEGESAEKTLWVGSAYESIQFAHSFANSFSVLATWGWDAVPRVRGGWCESQKWRTVELYADAQIDDPQELAAVIAEPESFLPHLERLLQTEAVDAADSCRYLVCNKFNNEVLVWRYGRIASDFVRVYGLGRYYARGVRHETHKLTRSILAHKEAAVFPAAWVQAVAQAVKDVDAPCLVITAVPARPGRPDRMRAFLRQIEASGLLDGLQVVFAPDLLAFRNGVRSQHEECGSAQERIANVRDHLVVKDLSALADAPVVMVIDDVCTTGATFYYARERLVEAGACGTVSLALSLTSDARRGVEDFPRPAPRFGVSIVVDEACNAPLARGYA